MQGLLAATAVAGQVDDKETEEKLKAAEEERQALVDEQKRMKEEFEKWKEQYQQEHEGKEPTEDDRFVTDFGQIWEWLFFWNHKPCNLLLVSKHTLWSTVLFVFQE